jgi:site-specific DNA-cytosine methylase
MRGFGDYTDDDTASAIKARDWKDATDLVVHNPILIDRSAFNQGVNAQYDTHISDHPVTPSLVARGPHAVAVSSMVIREREGKAGGGKGPLYGEEKSHSLIASNDQKLFVAPIGFSHTQGLSAQPSETAWPTLRTEGAGMAVNDGTLVRRLTPLECERLMGWPDDWTAGQSDTHRYKQCGNGVASPVAQWIGEQIINL